MPTDLARRNHLIERNIAMVLSDQSIDIHYSQILWLGQFQAKGQILSLRYLDIRELSQGNAASCATQEATNLDGTAFFGPLCLTSAFANERRSSAEYSQLCVWRHHPYSHKNRMCNCVCTCNAWTDTLAKEGLWLANPSAASGLPVRPCVWRLLLWIRGVRRVSSS